MKNASYKGKPVFMQQDNAKLHIPRCDEKIFEAGASNRWRITLKNQTENFPDYYLLDFGYFTNIQSLQQE